ncbi:MAG: PD40 domain-containing protein [Bacteroidales bacterium]|nr:PD40 domain-containing protein [Bacteroidales bacterium]
MLAVCASMIFNFHFSLFNSAKAQYKVVHLEAPYNTAGSETGAIRVGDTILAYSSMQPAKGNNKAFHFATSQMNVFQARIAKNGKIAKPRPSRWGINDKRDHTGNLAIDPWANDLYFTRCRIDDPDLRCEIWHARKLKRGWAKAVRLRGDVNLEGYTATHPAVGHLKDSTVILYFASNRPGGMGGMDIWYTLLHGERSGECVNLGPQVNSPADEITPFYDQRNEVLYFSSDRMGGKGGYDIYTATGQRNTWKAAQSVCGCLNSEQNDIYFTITDRDSASGFPVGGYLASNRADSYYMNDSMCCNDLYRWGLDTALILERLAADTVESTDTIVERVRKFMFPLFLYFHNDEPDPTSRQPVTERAYSDCQRSYAARRTEYIAKQKNADDSAMMVQFFDTCVVGNYQRVEQLFDYVESLLDDGKSITLTIAGYASPVFKSEYNRVLSQRRIVSFINMVRAWRGGVFDDAMTDGRLFVQQQPHGAVEPTTESQSKDPVYGLPAALARRIEILSCEVR